jgi:transcriptional regulator with XRE-family HTH domain
VGYEIKFSHSPFFYKDIGMNKKLKIARIQSELSQHELSVITGISQAFISVIERGYRPPTRRQAELIADALGTKPEAIFSDIKGN